MILPILYYGHPMLRRKCEPITEITDEIRTLAADMIETSDATNGIGLSAPQVGRPIRLFVLRDYIETPDGHLSISDVAKVYINPKLSKPGRGTIIEPEGCLSIPGIRADVERPDRITIEAMDLNGNLFVEELEGYNARVRMHENDHINGVLFVDRVEPRIKRKIEPDLQRIKKKYNP